MEFAPKTVVQRKKPVAKKRKILLVDDEPIALDILKCMLNDEYEIEVAENGMDALFKVIEFQPEVVLLDARMPEVDGWEVCKQIKKSRFTDHIKVVMTSALAVSDDDRLSGLRAGADFYLPKQCIQRDLLIRILENPAGDLSGLTQ